MRAASAARLGDAREIVLREREDDRDRIELRHDDDAARIGGVHDVARVDEANARDAVDRRRDVRVRHVELRGVDLRFVREHRGGRRVDRGAIVVDLLLRDEPLPRELAVTHERDLRVALRRDVLRALRGRLLLLDLERARVDERERVALLHELPLAVEHLVEAPVDERLDGHGVERRHRAEALDDDGHVLLLDARDVTGTGRSRAPLSDSRAARAARERTKTTATATTAATSHQHDEDRLLHVLHRCGERAA